MQIRPREILYYATPNGRNPYRQSDTRIKDQKTQIAISNRISRLRLGNFGDFKRLDKDLYEIENPSRTRISHLFWSLSK